MNPSRRNYGNRLAVGLILIAAALALGCASASRWTARSPRIPDASALQGFLGRWDSWGSLGARVKFKAVIGDSTFQARGHLVYLIGERYEVGFAKPYNQLLGNLYITPTQLVYWDAAGQPQVFSADESASLDELLPLDLPNWDPRDLLPFPVSGRTSGFQVDSLWVNAGRAYVLGHSDDVEYRLTILDAAGSVGEERVLRRERDPIIKEYGRTRFVKDWPLSSRVTCSDTSGQVSITWYLGGIVLDAAPRLNPSEEY